MTRSERTSLIRAHTVASRPFLCPELALRLITPDCPLWQSDLDGLERLGLPEPFWGFAWPGGQALARYVLDHPILVEGRSVLDFGSGGGVVAVAALKAGAARVMAADTDPWAADAVQLNAALNGGRIEVHTRDLVGTQLDGWDVVLAGDVCYEAGLALRVLDWLRELSSTGILIRLADPDRGPLVGRGLEPVAAYDAPTDVDPGGIYLDEVCVYRIAALTGTSSRGCPSGEARRF